MDTPSACRFVLQPPRSRPVLWWVWVVGRLLRFRCERTVPGVVQSDLSESALWARALEGDGRAFASLFDAHVDRVFRHVLRMVPSAADADEVASASFFELWRRRTRVRLVNDSVLPWLLVTATNLARNASRGSRRYAAVIARLPRTAEIDVDPADRAADLERQQTLLRTLRTLSSVDASLIVLTSLEGLTTHEASQALGLSVVAARARLQRARRKLQAALNDSPLLVPSAEEVQP